MNKLIVVTGGTQGIGRAIVEKFGAAGFDVATCARNGKDLESLAADFKKKHHAAIFVHQADLADVKQARVFSEFVLNLDRSIDILVNNAGHFIPGEIIAEPEGALESMISSNVYSAYHVTRGLIRQIRDQGQGHIFNMCSIASIKAYPNGGSYTISKFALLGFSKVLREELKESGVRVTAVIAGATRTASWEGTDLPADRFMKATDVADAIYGTYALSGRSVVEEIILRPQLGDI